MTEPINNTAETAPQLYDEPLLADITLPEPTDLSAVLERVEQINVVDGHVHYGINTPPKEFARAVAENRVNQLPGYLGSQEQYDALMASSDPAMRQRLAFAAAIVNSPSYDKSMIQSGKERLQNYPFTSNLMDIKALLKGSKYGDGAVVLATDAPVTYGQRDVASGAFYVSNQAVLELVTNYNNDKRNRGKKLYYGASINPASETAIDELIWAKSRGAVLVKLFFATWGYLADGRVTVRDDVDPELKHKLTEFYRIAASLDMPILLHTGYEDGILGPSDPYSSKVNGGDPSTMIPIFASGNDTVVLAHTGFYGHHLDAFRDKPEHMSAAVGAMYGYPDQVWGEVSGAGCQNYEFFGAIAENYLSRHPDLFDKLVYGTDYPIKDYSHGELKKLIKLSKDYLRRPDLSDRDRRIYTLNLGVAKFLLKSPEYKRAKNPFDRRVVFLAGMMSYLGVSVEDQVAFFERANDLYVEPEQ